MISEDLTGIIELGNIKIKCLIFKIKSDGTAEILSSSITPSDGIHNDVIVNLTKASNAIRTCISQAEKKIKVSLKLYSMKRKKGVPKRSNPIPKTD